MSALPPIQGPQPGYSVVPIQRLQERRLADERERKRRPPQEDAPEPNPEDGDEHIDVRV